MSQPTKILLDLNHEFEIREMCEVEIDSNDKTSTNMEKKTHQSSTIAIGGSVVPPNLSL